MFQKKFLVPFAILFVVAVVYAYLYYKEVSNDGLYQSNSFNKSVIKSVEGGAENDSVIRGRIIVDLIYFSNLMKIKTNLNLDSTLDYSVYEREALLKGDKITKNLAKENFDWKVQFYSVFPMQDCDEPGPKCEHGNNCDCAIYAGCCCPGTNFAPNWRESRDLKIIWNEGDVVFLNEQKGRIDRKKYTFGKANSDKLLVFLPLKPEEVAFVAFYPKWQLPWKKYVVDIRELKNKVGNEAITTKNAAVPDIISAYRRCK